MAEQIKHCGNCAHRDNFMICDICVIENGFPSHYEPEPPEGE